MATNLVYRNTDAQNRVEDLGATIAPGAPVVSKAGLPAVAVTGSADYTVSEEIPGVGTLSGVNAGGVGLKGQEVTLAFDGTWEFLATSFDGTAPNPATIAQGTEVYITAGGKLTTTAGSNTAFGYVDVPPSYDRSRGFVPVRIGV